MAAKGTARRDQFQANHHHQHTNSHFYAPPHGVIKCWWPLSVHPSVPWPTPIWQWKDVASWKWQKESPWHGSKGQRLRSPCLLTPWLKIARSFGRGRPTNFKTWHSGGIQRPISLKCEVTSKVKGQGNKVMSSVWCMFVHNLTTKVAQKHQNWQESCPCNGWHSAPVTINHQTT